MSSSTAITTHPLETLTDAQLERHIDNLKSWARLNSAEIEEALEERAWRMREGFTEEFDVALTTAGEDYVRRYQGALA